MQVSADVLDQFKCTICTRIMHPPIHLCILGHSFCDRCFQWAKRCGVCRQLKGKGRNYALERLHNKVILPCIYKPEGCELTDLGLNIQSHEQYCDYLIIQCPLRILNDCAWIGRVKDIPGHCSELHMTNVYNSSEQKIRLSKFLTETKMGPGLSESYCMLFSACKQLFQCIIDMDPKTGIAGWCVLFLGPRKDAKKYHFHITFENSDNLELTMGCQPLDNHTYDYLETDREMLRKFSRNGHLNYRMSISKTSEK